jgi:hypothetical protein
MKTSLRGTIVAIVALLTGGLAAQTKIPGIPSGTQLNPGRLSADSFIVIGCISRVEGSGSHTFVIADPRATPATKFRIEGTPDLLQFHVGHTVEIAGTIAPITNGISTLRAMKMQSLTYISSTCIAINGGASRR